MSRALEPGEVKALFRQLVIAAGGVDASGVVLGVSHQRVSQLQSINCPDQPTFAQIMALEVIAEADVITGAASRAVRGAEQDEITAAAVEAVSAGADALRLVHSMETDGSRDMGEIRGVQRATQAAAKSAVQLADAAARLTPARR